MLGFPRPNGKKMQKSAFPFPRTATLKLELLIWAIPGSNDRFNARFARENFDFSMCFFLKKQWFSAELSCICFLPLGFFLGKWRVIWWILKSCVFHSQNTFGQVLVLGVIFMIFSWFWSISDGFSKNPCVQDRQGWSPSVHAFRTKCWNLGFYKVSWLWHDWSRGHDPKGYFGNTPKGLKTFRFSSRSPLKMTKKTSVFPVRRALRARHIFFIFHCFPGKPLFLRP